MLYYTSSADILYTYCTYFSLYGYIPTQMLFNIQSIEVVAKSNLALFVRGVAWGDDCSGSVLGVTHLITEL